MPSPLCGRGVFDRGGHAVFVGGAPGAGDSGLGSEMVAGGAVVVVVEGELVRRACRPRSRRQPPCHRLTCRQQARRPVESSRRPTSAPRQQPAPTCPAVGSVVVSAHATANGVTLTINTTINSNARIEMRMCRSWRARRHATRDEVVPVETLRMISPAAFVPATCRHSCPKQREGRSHHSLAPGALQVTVRSWRSSLSVPVSHRNLTERDK